MLGTTSDLVVLGKRTAAAEHRERISCRDGISAHPFTAADIDAAPVAEAATTKAADI
jgi:hypothetical protein